MSGLSWCFTVKNFTDEDIQRYESGDYWYSLAFSVFDKDLNACVDLKEELSCEQVKKLVKTSRVTKRDVPINVVVEYLQKGEGFKRLVKLPPYSDVLSLAVREGMEAVYAFTNDPLKIREALVFLSVYNTTKESWPKLIWFYGEPELTTAEIKRLRCAPYIKSATDGLWPGYDGQDYVSIDNFTDTWLELSELLKLLDSKGTTVETEPGIFKPFNPLYIEIVASKRPEKYYNGELASRISKRIKIQMRDDIGLVRREK